MVFLAAAGTRFVQTEQLPNVRWVADESRVTAGALDGLRVGVATSLRRSGC
jgi:hypothetical protein